MLSTMPSTLSSDKIKGGKPLYAFSPAKQTLNFYGWNNRNSMLIDVSIITHMFTLHSDRYLACGLGFRILYYVRTFLVGTSYSKRCNSPRDSWRWWVRTANKVSIYAHLEHGMWEYSILVHLKFDKFAIRTLYNFIANFQHWKIIIVTICNWNLE